MYLINLRFFFWCICIWYFWDFWKKTCIWKMSARKSPENRVFRKKKSFFLVYMIFWKFGRKKKFVYDFRPPPKKTWKKVKCIWYPPLNEALIWITVVLFEFIIWYFNTSPVNVILRNFWQKFRFQFYFWTSVIFISYVKKFRSSDPFVIKCFR